MITITYDPCTEACKRPVGAVRLGDPMTIRFHTDSREIGQVFLVLKKDNEQPVRYACTRTEVQDKTGYQVTVEITTKGLYFYHFELWSQDIQYLVGRDACLGAQTGSDREWLVLVYERQPVQCDWLAGGVIYQIFPDRFCIGGERLKSKPYARYREDWDGVPEYQPRNESYNTDFFGGNLAGITQKLPYLKALGVTCLYLNPIFEAHSNHKYDTGNYRKVDPDFGSLNDLDKLIESARKRGIRIILDGVFSHTGEDSIYFNKQGSYDGIGAYQSQESPYYEWYTFSEYPDAYDCWWGIRTLPNVREENVHYNEFVNGEEGIVRTYIRMGVMGWRLDVADELPDVFLDRLYAAAKRENPQAVVIGEVWEDASYKSAYGARRRYLQGGQMDSVTNYPLKEAILAFVKQGNGLALHQTMLSLINNYPAHVLHSLMNVLGTHDTYRVINHFGRFEDSATRAARAHAKLKNRKEAAGRVKLAAVLQFTLPGVPCVYYGDEVGLEGFEDPFNRACYPWAGGDKDLLRFYRKLGKIRAANKTLFAQGNYTNIFCTENVFAFERQHGYDRILVVVNAGTEDFVYPCDAYTDLFSMRMYQGNVKKESFCILKKNNI